MPKRGKLATAFDASGSDHDGIFVGMSTFNNGSCGGGMISSVGIGGGGYEWWNTRSSQGSELFSSTQSHQEEFHYDKQ